MMCFICIVCFLQNDANYTYKIGVGTDAREFWFITPPKPHPDASHIFGVIGM